jgi:hypothetical protein
MLDCGGGWEDEPLQLRWAKLDKASPLVSSTLPSLKAMQQRAANKEHKEGFFQSLLPVHQSWPERGRRRSHLGCKAFRSPDASPGRRPQNTGVSGLHIPIPGPLKPQISPGLTSRNTSKKMMHSGPLSSIHPLLPLFLQASSRVYWTTSFLL